MSRITVSPWPRKYARSGKFFPERSQMVGVFPVGLAHEFLNPLPHLGPIQRPTPF